MRAQQEYRMFVLWGLRKIAQRDFMMLGPDTQSTQDDKFSVADSLSGPSD